MKKILYNKRFMTMLETLIALSLTMLILSTMTFFYRQIITIEAQVENVQNESFRMRYVENRLAAILPQAISESDEKKDFFFFSTSSSFSSAMPGSPNLLFTYDNGVKLDKEFSNHVIGRLYLDNGGSLSLATWPSPSRWVAGENPAMKREVLLDNVKELKFGFFVAPEKEWRLEKNESSKGNTETASSLKPTPEGQWLPSWSVDYKQLPALVKVEVTLQNGITRIFSFPLPKTERQPVYKQ